MLFPLIGNFWYLHLGPITTSQYQDWLVARHDIDAVPAHWTLGSGFCPKTLVMVVRIELGGDT
jgi:hypothetical protein